MDKKLISLPKEQIDYIDKRCKEFGINFSEYVRKMIMIEMMEQESYQRMKEMEGNAFKNFAGHMDKLKEEIYKEKK